MRILMCSNTYAPHVGGVARSVEAFAKEYRRLGHQVLIVSPHFKAAQADEADMVRIPAIQDFNGSDFSVPVPIPGLLHDRLEEFKPEIVHTHHPFLLGDTALRISARLAIPAVFTHHTQYEKYTHYVPGDSPLMQRFVIELTSGYCDLCEAVVAPSESIRDLLRQRGVRTRIEVVPTGVDLERFQQGDGDRFRRENGVSQDAFVVGHVGRLAPEKNLHFLSRAVAAFLKSDPRAHCIIAGQGRAEAEICEVFREAGVDDRLHLKGVLTGQELPDAYAAMDVFAFASKTETQGMVLTEALAAGSPVVAIDASGVREVVRDGANGRLLATEDVEKFVEALRWIEAQGEEEQQTLLRGVRETAERFSLPVCAKKALSLYEALIADGYTLQDTTQSSWNNAMRRIGEEWKIWSNVAEAMGDALMDRRDGGRDPE